MQSSKSCVAASLFMAALLCIPAALAAQQQPDDASATQEDTSVARSSITTGVPTNESADVPDPDAESPFRFALSGFTRVSFEKVQDDPQYDFIGRNDGFALQNARVHLDGIHRDGWLRFRTGIEAASNPAVPVNTPEGEFLIAMRDAYVRLESHPWLGIQVGQMLAPFAAEDLRSRRDLLFARAAVGQSGVAVGRGLQEVSISTRRQIGVLVGSRLPVEVGPFNIGYALMVANGNGENQILNDNQALALYGRLELGWQDYVRLGAAALQNQRAAGLRPDRFDETDTGWTIDTRLHYLDLQIIAQFATVTTAFDTIDVPDRTRQAWHAEVAWRPAVGPIRLSPAYRIANYQPWRTDNTALTTTPFDFADLEVTEHTMGVAISDVSDIVRLMVAYTLADEPEARQVDNDRVECLLQLVFQ